MRAVIQRVSSACVTIAGNTVAEIKGGLLVLLGIEAADDRSDVLWLSKKIVLMRVFNDAAGMPNLSLLDNNGQLLLVSQFTLFASTQKGNRPSYIRAAPPSIAIPLYEAMITQLSIDLGKPISTGVFGADMQVHLVNDGPLTILIDTKNKAG